MIKGGYNVSISNQTKSNFTTREKVGTVYGLFYILLMCILIPILMYLDRSYSTSPTDFYPLSELSVSEYSKLYYKLILVLGGVSAFLLHHRNPRRPSMAQKPTYEELEQKVKVLERENVSSRKEREGIEFFSRLLESVDQVKLT